MQPPEYRPRKRQVPARYLPIGVRYADYIKGKLNGRPRYGALAVAFLKQDIPGLDGIRPRPTREKINEVLKSYGEWLALLDARLDFAAKRDADQSGGPAAALALHTVNGSVRISDPTLRRLLTTESAQ